MAVENNAEGLTPKVERIVRRAAYLPVLVRKYRYFPFLRVDVQLLDISKEGIKLQFAKDVSAKVGEQFWLEIPLTLVVAGAAGAEFIKAQCNWYRREDATLGAMFVAETKRNKAVVAKLLDDLKNAGRLPM